jgi:2-deoxystreptamine N-acetyl-D-glucosaminyltransferase/2-deoxystreptamine glucosyltransferase
VRLIYIGKGPDLQLLEQKIQNEGLQAQIIIMGYIKHELLPSLINQSTVLITPTQSTYPESRCKAAIEGMVLGKPVIAPAFGPFPYVFKHGYNGMLYKPDSISDLREKIYTVMTDNALYASLLQGAEETGNTLMDAELTFRKALELAFKHT